MNPTVLITDYTFLDFSRYESELSGTGARLVHPLGNSVPEFLRLRGDADALIHEHLDLTREIIGGLDRCRIIAHHGKGVDNIDVEEATRRGILIANVLDASMHEVSEHVFALLLHLARGVGKGDAAVRGGSWHVSDVGRLHRLAGRTLGLVGFGNIARHVARKAAAFGMKVIVYARSPNEELAKAYDITFVELERVFSDADVVSLHLPLNEQTQCIASPDRLSTMKAGAILINVSRGGLIDEAALADLLAAGRIAGAGLDVLTEEPPRAGHPLLALPNVVVTPHSAWYSEEGVEEVERRTAREVARALRGEWPVSLVNPQAMQTYVNRWGPMREPA